MLFLSLSQVYFICLHNFIKFSSTFILMLSTNVNIQERLPCSLFYHNVSNKICMHMKFLFPHLRYTTAPLYRYEQNWKCSSISTFDSSLPITALLTNVSILSKYQQVELHQSVIQYSILFQSRWYPIVTEPSQMMMMMIIQAVGNGYMQ